MVQLTRKIRVVELTIVIVCDVDRSKKLPKCAKQRKYEPDGNTANFE